MVWRTEGMSSFARTTSLQYHDAMRKHMDIYLLGILGEFSGSHTWPQLLFARSRSAAIEAIFSRLLGARQGYLSRIFTDSFRKRHFDSVRQRFIDSFQGIWNDHPMDMADCWNFVHLHPRDTYHSPSVDRALFEARAPHMDKDLVDFLLTIRPSARLEQRVYKKMIAYSYPDIRDVPCTNSATPINPHFATEYAMMCARYAGRKLFGPLRDAVAGRKALGRETGDVNEDFRQEPQLVDDILHPLLRQGVFPSEIFDHSGIEAIIDAHYEKHQGNWEILSLLISWGLGAKYFLHDDLSDLPPETFVQ